MAFGPEYRCASPQLTFGKATARELKHAPPITEGDRQWLSPEFQAILDEPQQLHDYLKGDETLSWVIRSKGDLAGLAIIHAASYYTAYGRALVYPEFQNQGIGEKAQLLRMHHWFTVLGENALMSYFYQGNTRSQKLAERHGYYHVRDEIDPSSGKDSKVYRAVNPVLWRAVHSGDPHVNATVGAREQLSTKLDIARSLFTRM